MNKRTYTLLAAIAIWSVAAVWMMSWLSDFPGEAALDTLGQYALLQQGIYQNWKPALYEFQLSVGEKIWPGQGIGLAYIAQIIAMGVGCALIFTHYVRHHVLYALGILMLPLLCVGMIQCIKYVVNDCMAAACYVLYIGVVLSASDCRGKKVKLLLTVLGIGLLFYGFVLRHNSVFAVIVLAFWGVNKLLRHVSFAKKGVISIVSVLLFALVNSVVTNVLLQCEKTYPLKSPLADDVINICVLGNQWEPIFLQHYDVKGVEPKEITFMPEAGHRNPIISGVYQSPDVKEREEDFRTLSRVWLETVTNHPLRYLGIKVFFFHQYLMAARIIPWVGDWMQARYPHAEISLYNHCRMRFFWMNRQFAALVVVPLIVYGVVAWVGISWLFRRRKCLAALSETEKDALCIGFAAMMYTASYFFFVTSVSEFRYYCPRLFLAGISASLLGISFVLRMKKRLFS